MRVFLPKELVLYHSNWSQNKFPKRAPTVWAKYKTKSPVVVGGVGVKTLPTHTLTVSANFKINLGLVWYFPGPGVGVGGIKTKANLAQFQ